MKSNLIEQQTIKSCIECAAETAPEDVFCQECGVILNRTISSRGEALGEADVPENDSPSPSRFAYVIALTKNIKVPKLPTAMPALLGLGFFAVSIPWCVHAIDQSYDTMAEDYIADSAAKALKNHNAAEAAELLSRALLEKGRLTKEHLSLMSRALILRANDSIQIKDFTAAHKYLHAVPKECSEYAAAQNTIKQLESKGMIATMPVLTVPMPVTPGPASAAGISAVAAPGTPGVAGAPPAGAAAIAPAPPELAAPALGLPASAGTPSAGPKPNAGLTPPLAVPAIASVAAARKSSTPVPPEPTEGAVSAAITEPAAVVVAPHPVPMPHANLENETKNSATAAASHTQSDIPIWQKVSHGGIINSTKGEKTKSAMSTQSRNADNDHKETPKQRNGGPSTGFLIDGNEVNGEATGAEKERNTEISASKAGLKSYNPDDVSRYNELLADYFRQHDSAPGQPAEKESGNEPPSFQEWVSKGKPGFR